MLSLNLFHTPYGRESDDLMESGGNNPHLVDLRSTQNDIVSNRTVQHNEGNVEVDSNRIDQEGDVPQHKLLFTAEPNEDCGATMDVRLIYVHLL